MGKECWWQASFVFVVSSMFSSFYLLVFGALSCVFFLDYFLSCFWYFLTLSLRSSPTAVERKARTLRFSNGLLSQDFSVGFLGNFWGMGWRVLLLKVKFHLVCFQTALNNYEWSGKWFSCCRSEWTSLAGVVLSCGVLYSIWHSSPNEGA